MPGPTARWQALRSAAPGSAQQPQDKVVLVLVSNQFPAQLEHHQSSSQVVTVVGPGCASAHSGVGSIIVLHGGYGLGTYSGQVHVKSHDAHVGFDAMNEQLTPCQQRASSASPVFSSSARASSGSAVEAMHPAVAEPIAKRKRAFAMNLA